MNGNGKPPGPSPLVDAQNRPLTRDEPLPYPLGDMAVTIAGSAQQKYQDAYARHLMPEIAEPPDAVSQQTPANLAQVRSLFGWIRILWEVGWQSTSMSVAQLAQGFAEIQLRLEGVERALNTILEGGYTPPSMPSHDEIGVYQPNQHGSGVRVWPQPDGTYPPFTVPAEGLFALGRHRVEVEPGDVMTRTDEGGLNLTRGEETMAIPQVEMPA